VARHPLAFSKNYDSVLLAGDWNASIQGRHKEGMLTLHDTEADKDLQKWINENNWKHFTTAGHTFSRDSPYRVRTTLDHFFWAAKDPQPISETRVREDVDLTYDHRAIILQIRTNKWSPLPILYEMTRKIRIHNGKWEEKGQQWTKAIEEVVNNRMLSEDNMTNSDEFAQLEQAMKITRQISKDILGLTGKLKKKGEQQTVKPRVRVLSTEERKCTKQLRLLRVALRNIHGMSSARNAATHAMIKLLDQNIVPTDREPIGFRRRPNAPQFQDWLTSWKTHIRNQIAEL
jgi:hypothetical protein